jgi:Skp family chaperone for outer membrane proteins
MKEFGLEYQFNDSPKREYLADDEYKQAKKELEDKLVDLENQFNTQFTAMKKEYQAEKKKLMSEVSNHALTVENQKREINSLESKIKSLESDLKARLGEKEQIKEFLGDADRVSGSDVILKTVQNLILDIEKESFYNRLPKLAKNVMEAIKRSSSWSEIPKFMNSKGIQKEVNNKIGLIDRLNAKQKDR